VLGLSGIALIFVTEALFDTSWTSRAETEARRLHDASLTSLELVARIGRDVDQERILLDDHIFEHRNFVMATVEAHLRAVDADLEAARIAYRPLVELPNELPTWQRADAEVTGFKEAMERALVFSRENRDEEARAAMSPVLQEYADLDERLGTLLEINRVGAADSVTRMSALESSAERIVLAARIAGLIVVMLLGRWSLGRVAEYEGRQAELLATLEDRNRELDAFAGRIAHELRGPISTLGLTTNQLARTVPDQAPAIGRMQRANKRLDDMIQDLLSLSRLGSPPPSGSSDPARVAAKIAEDVEERFHDEANLHRDVVAANVSCGEGLLQQALWNLVENGVKYRRADVKAQLELSGHIVSGSYELRVTDNGMGMSAEDAHHAFEAFFRAERARAVIGSGLGLSIVKRIADASHGTVSVESRLDHGTTFILRLPLGH
jgi:signal transduction histidine kinase